MDIYLAAIEARQVQVQQQSIATTHYYHESDPDKDKPDMGLIRDGIGQALGANQVQTGFNGPKMPFSSKPNTSASSPARSPRRLPPKPDYQTYSNSSGLERPDSLAPYGDSYSSRSPSKDYPQQYGLDDGRPSSSYRNNESWPGQSQYADVPPAYGTQLDYPFTYRNDQSARNDPYSRQNADPWMRDSSYTQPYQDQRSSYYDNTQMQGSRSMRGSGFRPLALPQVEYGDGKPFLRGYSDELRHYGIEEGQFIQILDTMNKAIIPNPENQIFQKAANIAGWFVPGSAGIGLMAGQIGVGIGAAFGHASMVAKTLSKANLDLFIPNGLEICIGHTKDLNNETGVSASSGGFRGSNDPETRLAEYGNSVAPLSVVYPRQQNIGRQDPIAMLARGIGSRDNQKKIGKANKEAQKGKKSKKGDSLEGDVKWLIVRKATPDSVAHWKQTLQQSEAALAEERAQANGR